MSEAQLILGDCVHKMREMPPNSVDAVVTDPPYGIRFMGKAWDAPGIAHSAQRDKEKMGDNLGPMPSLDTAGVSAGRKKARTKSAYAGDSNHAGQYDHSLKGNQAFQAWTEVWAREAFRVLKPGGHMLVSGSPRTYHRMVSGIEDAGFEIRDTLQWIYGSGFPKSKNVGNGWGTALKPAHEPIVLARKPLSESSVARQVLETGTGAINVDACRVQSAGPHGTEGRKKFEGFKGTEIWGGGNGQKQPPNPGGRWPPNLLLDEYAAELLDEQSGQLHPPGTNGHRSRKDVERSDSCYSDYGTTEQARSYTDKGGASRFFPTFKYCAKASRKERGEGNNHPTVKPLALMDWLVTLVTPPGGTVLDPFTGSGSTGCAAVRCGFDFIGIEQEAEYIQIAQRRIEHSQAQASETLFT